MCTSGILVFFIVVCAKKTESVEIGNWLAPKIVTSSLSIALAGLSNNISIVEQISGVAFKLAGN